MSRLTEASSHPEHLPWYVAGKVGEGESREIERHLLECEECRDQAAALVSLKRDLRLADAGAHPTEQELVAYTRGEQRIEAHLAACAACRQDLEALRVSDARLATRDSRRGIHARWVVAAAVLFVAVAAGVMLLVPRAPHSSAITLEPVGRSLPGGIVMSGNGPWVVTLVLPFGSPDGDYSVRLNHGEGSQEIPLGRPRLTAARGLLELSLQELPAGAYRLMVTPGGGSVPDRPIVYPFLVSGSP